MDDLSKVLLSAVGQNYEKTRIGHLASDGGSDLESDHEQAGSMHDVSYGHLGSGLQNGT